MKTIVIIFDYDCLDKYILVFSFVEFPIIFKGLKGKLTQM